MQSEYWRSLIGVTRKVTRIQINIVRKKIFTRFVLCSFKFFLQMGNGSSAALTGPVSFFPQLLRSEPLFGRPECLWGRCWWEFSSCRWHDSSQDWQREEAQKCLRLGTGIYLCCEQGSPLEWEGLAPPDQDSIRSPKQEWHVRIPLLHSADRLVFSCGRASPTSFRLP